MVNMDNDKGYNPEDEECNLKRLRWQCRRGIKEVEVILGPFFENHFETLSDDLKQEFVTLLECGDAELFEWLMQRNYPNDGPQRKIMQAILSTLDRC